MVTLSGSVIAFVGAVFLFLAALGLVRMPDVYNRMQAGTKATTLGSMLVFTGFALVMPEAWPRLVLLMLFILLTNPLSSHALARSAHIQGVPVGTDRDDLAEANAAEAFATDTDSGAADAGAVATSGRGTGESRRLDGGGL